MRFSRSIIGIVAVWPLLAPSMVWAQRGSLGMIEGIVRDAATRDPLPFVLVDITVPGEESRRAESDADGRFRFRGVTPQLVQVRLRSLGYRTVERFVNVFAGRTASVEYLMLRSEVVLPDLTVDAPAAPATVLMAGFEDRRKMGFGTFYDAADLERLRHRQMVDLVREAAGVRIIRSALNEQFAVSNRRRVGMQTAAGRDCYMQVVIDGMMYWTPDNGGEITFRSGPPPDLGHLVATSELAGMEVYAGMSGVPVEYRRDGVHCGTIVFWTKRGSMRPPPPRGPGPRLDP